MSLTDTCKRRMCLYDHIHMCGGSSMQKSKITRSVMCILILHGIVTRTVAGTTISIVVYIVYTTVQYNPGVQAIAFNVGKSAWGRA